MANGDPDQAFLCLEKQKAVLEKTGYIKSVTVYYYTAISNIYLMKGEHQNALNIITEGYQKYKDKLSEEDKNRFDVLELTVLESQNKHREVLARIDEILPKTKDKKHQAILYAMKASSVNMMGEYEKAASYYHQALKIAKSINDTFNIPTIYNRLGLLNQRIKEPQKALDYYTEGLKYAKRASNKIDMLAIYANMGSIYRELDSLEKSLEYYQMSTELAKNLRNQTDVARNLLNAGMTYLDMNNLPQAFTNFYESLDISYQEDISIGKLYNYIGLGKAYSKSNKFQQSKISFDSALVYAKKMKMPTEEADIYYGLYKTYEKAGDYKNSLFYYINSDSIKNNLLSEEKQKAIAEIEIKYQTELKDAEIEKINFTLEKKQAQNKTLIFGLISLVIITSLVFLFLIYRNKALRKLYERNIELMNSFKNSVYKEASQKEFQNTDEQEEDNLKNIFEKLLCVLENDKIYTDPNISLSKTAEIIKSNEKYVSSAIATYAKTNYSNFINSYRINQAKLLIYENNNLNINEVMYVCGFNSRTTFYEAFKKHTGMSPRQFKDLKTEAKIHI
ncbi:MAG: tetratricopeptide repeat protein [Flavobacteriaceae bacterium]